jgi:hypothetical protein
MHMATWTKTFTREPPKSKDQLREMLAEAVRNTQAENKRLQRAKKDPGEKAA